MATAVLERTVSQVGLHARCMEAALHRPQGWSAVSDGLIVPLHIDIREDRSILSVIFVAGPMPAGERTVSLLFDGDVMFSKTIAFEDGSWWKHRISARLG